MKSQNPKISPIHIFSSIGKQKAWLNSYFRMISKPDFEKFLKEIQCENFSNAKIDEVIADCIQHDDDQAAGEKTQAAWASRSFGIYGFAHYINNYTNIFDEKLTDQVGEYPGQSMDQPITSYWIASSHNTYLEKDQLGKVENTKDRIKIFHFFVELCALRVTF